MVLRDGLLRSGHLRAARGIGHPASGTLRSPRLGPPSPRRRADRARAGTRWRTDKLRSASRQTYTKIEGMPTARPGHDGS